MDLSKDKSIAFVAGASHKDTNGRSEGVLAALDFKKKLSVLAEKKLTNEKIQACTAMVRAEQHNHLIVGCYKQMLIVDYADKEFTVLKRIENVHTSKVVC